mgnify:CR=1 FL=1|jgi:hypothetical protein
MEITTTWMGKFDFKPIANLANFYFKPTRFRWNNILARNKPINLPALNVIYFQLSSPNVTFHDGYFGVDWDINVQAWNLKKICGEKMCPWKSHGDPNQGT